jgi:predicted CXXCH cytochrome family protein
MPLEWLLLGLLLLVALWPLVRRPRSTLVWCLAVGLVSVAVGSASLWQVRLEKAAWSQRQLIEKIPRQGRPGGYVTSDTCQSCHPDQHASWHRSYHRTMTQVATPETVRGKFDRVTLGLREERYHLERRGNEFWVDMVDPDWKYVRLLKQHHYDTGRAPSPPPPEPNPPRATKRVGLLTGSHHMQAYWVPSQFGNEQFSLPFTYLFEEERWVPRNDVFLLPPDTPTLQQVWNVNCINCHTTAGQPRKDASTHVSDTRVAEYGISCEACHGPAEKHVQVNSNPRRRHRAHSQNVGDPTIVNPARLSHQKSSEVCSQCHAIRQTGNREDWMAHGFRYLPGGDNLETARPVPRKESVIQEFERAAARSETKSSWDGSYWADGMVRVSGREYNGLKESACFKRGTLSCLSCHSMHQSDPNDQLAVGMSGNQACLQCHQNFSRQLEQHTHHPANSSGSLCYNCHMPHTTYGLLKAIRSHWIDSPDVQASVKTGRPNACNLCHLDRSLAWTQKHLSNWYGSREMKLSIENEEVSAAVLWLLKGDAGQRALIAWHMGWLPAREASGTNWLAPYLAETLTDPYSVVRYIGQRSLKRLPGFGQFAYDYIAAPEDRARARRDALNKWQSEHASSVKAQPSVLIKEEGALQEQKIAALLRQRNHRRLELLE